MNIYILTRLQRSSLILTLYLSMTPLITSADNNLPIYLGDLYTYEKAESYSSIFDGRVYLLEPGGYDVFHDASWALLIEGVISNETTQTVQTLLRRIPGITLIFFDSPGGDLFAGLTLGKLLASGDYQTIVNDGNECESACALAFLGGRSRKIIAEPNKFGFHRQYYIRNNKIQYGSWSDDITTIAQYLKEINFVGIQADEVVGTSGLVTYSDNRLEDRGLVTETRRDHRKIIEKTFSVTGASIIERYFASCLIRLIREKVSICEQYVPVFRLPMLLAYMSEIQDYVLSDDFMTVISQFLPKKGMKNKDLSHVNCGIMRELYLDWLDARYELFLSRSPPNSVIKSYERSYNSEQDSCKSYLDANPAKEEKIY